jgi:hypothetical protein
MPKRRLILPVENLRSRAGDLRDQAQRLKHRAAVLEGRAVGLERKAGDMLARQARRDAFRHIDDDRTSNSARLSSSLRVGQAGFLLPPADNLAEG